MSYLAQRDSLVVQLVQGLQVERHQPATQVLLDLYGASVEGAWRAVVRGELQGLGAAGGTAEGLGPRGLWS